MKPSCPNCKVNFSRILKNGYYYRKSDSKKVAKFICKECKKNFSLATFSPAYRQRKRKVNYMLRSLLCSSVSQRRCAKILNLNRKTVARKLVYLSSLSLLKHEKWLKEQPKKFKSIQFDDLETFEFSKLKPLTVSVAVENRTRKIIGFKVSQIGAKGLLVKKSIELYGKRKNTSYKNRDLLFQGLKEVIDARAVFSTDEHKHYPVIIKKHFPGAKHHTYPSIRGSIVGQGELKRTAFDPLFSVNHTLAMLRANISRLVRKTWCTTKKAEFLEKHLWVYVEYHNQILTNSS